MTLTIKPLPTIGAEVTGVDLRDASRESLAAIERAWLEHGVLIFRDQAIDDADLVRFSSYFGPVQEHPLKATRSSGNASVMELNSTNERTSPAVEYDGEEIVGRIEWHKDLIYTETLNRGAVLNAVTLPERYGQTAFADEGRAYDALPERLRRQVRDLEVVYDFTIPMGAMKFIDVAKYDFSGQSTLAEAGLPNLPAVVHPLVIRHPVSGRTILNLSPLFLARVVGMDEAESDALLRALVAHIRQGEFAYTHEWRRGDVLMWDNWRCMHMAYGTCKGMTRKMHRTTIMGEGGRFGRLAA